MEGAPPLRIFQDESQEAHTNDDHPMNIGDFSTSAKLTMHVKATFGDWVCQCVSFDFIRLKVPYERENDLINFFSEIGRSTKNAASRKSLEIQGYSITKPRTLLKRKFV